MGDPDGITAWQRINERTTTSGKLVGYDVIRLAELGVHRVINLAMNDHPEALEGEADRIKAAGMLYMHIPVPFDAPTEAHYEAFVRVYETDDSLVHIHCIANLRVSAFLYRYHRDRKGMIESDARAIMERHWSPDKGEHLSLAPWAQFIANRNG